jgi:hypothetical protein
VNRAGVQRFAGPTSRLVRAVSSASTGSWPRSRPIVPLPGRPRTRRSGERPWPRSRSGRSCRADGQPRKPVRSGPVHGRAADLGLGRAGDPGDPLPGALVRRCRGRGAGSAEQGAGERQRADLVPGCELGPGRDAAHSGQPGHRTAAAVRPRGHHLLRTGPVGGPVDRAGPGPPGVPAGHIGVGDAGFRRRADADLRQHHLLLGTAAVRRLPILVPRPLHRPATDFKVRCYAEGLSGAGLRIEFEAGRGFSAKCPQHSQYLVHAGGIIHQEPSRRVQRRRLILDLEPSSQSWGTDVRPSWSRYRTASDPRTRTGQAQLVSRTWCTC